MKVRALRWAARLTLADLSGYEFPLNLHHANAITGCEFRLGDFGVDIDIDIPTSFWSSRGFALHSGRPRPFAEQSIGNLCRAIGERFCSGSSGSQVSLEPDWRTRLRPTKHEYFDTPSPYTTADWQTKHLCSGVVLMITEYAPSLRFLVAPEDERELYDSLVERLASAGFSPPLLGAPKITQISDRFFIDRAIRLSSSGRPANEQNDSLVALFVGHTALFDKPAHPMQPNWSLLGGRVRALGEAVADQDLERARIIISGLDTDFSD